MQQEKTELIKLAQAWRLSVEATTLERVLSFCRLLLHWNRRINLTGVSSLETLVSRHLPDSFALASIARNGARAVDVGSGGGLPALPAALMCPQWKVALFEPTAKKAAFLRTAIREFGIDNARVEQTRVGLDYPVPGAPFDMAFSRAGIPVSAWLDLASSLVRPEGLVLAFVAVRAPPLPPASLRLEDELTYILPGGGKRKLIQYRRVDVSRGTSPATR